MRANETENVFCATNFPKKHNKKAFIPRNSSNTHSFMLAADSRKQKCFRVNERENDCSRLCVMVLEVETILSIRHIIFALTLA